MKDFLGITKTEDANEWIEKYQWRRDQGTVFIAQQEEKVKVNMGNIHPCLFCMVFKKITFCMDFKIEHAFLTFFVFFAVFCMNFEVDRAKKAGGVPTFYE